MEEWQDDPRQQVQGPALALKIFAAVGAALIVVWQALNLLGLGVAAVEGSGDAPEILASGAFQLISAIISLIGAGVIWFGGTRMAQLQSWGLCFGAAIVAMVPCTSPCCFLGLPFGIWALVVLNKPEVKAAFTS